MPSKATTKELKAELEQFERERVTDRLGNALGMGTDVAGRRIFLFGEVNTELSHKVVAAMQVLDSVKGTIFVTMNSTGGSESDGYAIYDAIRLAKNKVVIEGYGATQSIAALILQAADVRRLAPECRLMIHNGHVTLHGDVDVDEVAKLNKEVQDHTSRYHNILATRSGLTVDTVRQMCKEETFFTAEQAIKAGFADELIEYA